MHRKNKNTHLSSMKFSITLNSEQTTDNNLNRTERIDREKDDIKRMNEAVKIKTLFQLYIPSNLYNLYKQNKCKLKI